MIEDNCGDDLAYLHAYYIYTQEAYGMYKNFLREHDRFEEADYITYLEEILREEYSKQYLESRCSELKTWERDYVYHKILGYIPRIRQDLELDEGKRNYDKSWFNKPDNILGDTED